jgi:hypothetical protein
MVRPSHAISQRIPHMMATSDTRNVEWPASDLLEARVAADAVPAPGGTSGAGLTVGTGAAPVRHLSRLAIELAAAIRSTSESARDAQLAHIADEAKGVAARISAQLSDGSATLRQQSDNDIADIREWAKAEAARIKAESDARIATRKRLLDDQIAAHEAANHEREARLQATVAAYQQTMDQFFARFLAEEDPARLATIAETMPEPPSLEPFAEPDSTWADPSNPPTMASVAVGIDPHDGTMPGGEGLAAAARGESEPAWSADEAEAEAALITSSLEDDMTAAPPAPQTEGSKAGKTASTRRAPTEPEAAASPAPASPAPASPAPASPAPAAESGNAGEPRSTQVIVSGLVSVASVASFRRALGRTPGVLSVTVTSGPNSEFLFHVSHRHDVDFGTAIPSLPGFVAEITGVANGAVSVLTLDPETER